MNNEKEVPPPVVGSVSGLSPFKRLRVLLRPEKADLLAVLVFGVIIGLLLLASPIAVQSIVNAVTFGGQVQPLIVISLLLMLALTFATLLFCVQTWTVELLQERLFVRLVADLTARFPRVKIDEYNSGHGPELVNRFFDILTIQKAAPKLLIDTLGTLLAVVVGLSVLAVYHPLLLVFDIFLILAITLIIFLPLKRGERTAILESTAKYEVAAWLEEIVRVPHTFRHGGSEQWIFDKSDELTKSWVEKRKSHFGVLFGQIISVQLLYIISSVGLLSLGGWLVLKGSLSIGQLVAAELIVTGIVYSVSKSGKYLETWYDLMAAVYKVGQLLDVSVHRTGGEQPAPSEKCGAAIDLIDLSWNSSRGQGFYKGINLSIKPGESVVVSRLGDREKPSFFELLWRLHEPHSGMITLSGIDIRDLALDALRREIAVVSTIEVVNASIRENISLNRKSVTQKDVREAISMVGLDSVISSLPDRLETNIHPIGCVLSDDELARLMLARAIVDSPSVLVVDSIFENSSKEMRELIYRTLFKEDSPWTLILVSDRPEVIERSDHTLRLVEYAELNMNTER